MPGSLFHGPVDALCGVLDDKSHLEIRVCEFQLFCWEDIDYNCCATASIVWAQLGVFLICRNFASGGDLF